MPGENGAATIAEFEDCAAAALLPEMRAVHPRFEIRIFTEAPVPGLDDHNAARAAASVTEVSGIDGQGVG